MAYMNEKIATVFGGTGFVGTQVVRELAARGVRIKVATRVPERAYFLRPCGVVGQIVPFACDYSDESISRAVQGSEYVVNCIGILYQKKKDGFQRAHTDIPAAVAAACSRAKVQRFVHMSSLGVDQSGSKYAKSKLAGEKAVLENYPGAVILRPSVIFGEDDDFFNKFASMAQILPVLPLIGGGNTKFQPVFVGDVADAVMAGLFNPPVGDQDPRGKIYELGGPEILTFREIYQTMFRYTQQPRKLVTLPFTLAKFQALFLSMLPEPLLTRDQVESLKTDNVVSPDAYNFEDLNIHPHALESILPAYLESYRPGGRFGGDDVDDGQNMKKQAA